MLDVFVVIPSNLIFLTCAACFSSKGLFLLDLGIICSSGSYWGGGDHAELSILFRLNTHNGWL